VAGVSEVTRILDAIGHGDSKAAGELLPLVYDELRRLAAQKMAHESPGQTLQPTALVHEAYLRLVGQTDPHWKNRAHFFAAAAEAMRRILIDRARRKHAARHGGGQQRVDIADIEIAAAEKDDQLLAVNDALEKFTAVDPAKADLVKLRYFVGMTIEEAAAALDISPPSAKRHWTYARAWLRHELTAGQRGQD
jgi:RNA polymerase sigma factor (TIGR02999 family)